MYEEKFREMRRCHRSSACTLVLHSGGGRSFEKACTSSPCNSPSVSPSTYSMYWWLPEYANYGLSSSSFRYEYGIVFELLALKRFEDGAEYDQDTTKRRGKQRRETRGDIELPKWNEWERNEKVQMRREISSHSFLRNWIINETKSAILIKNASKKRTGKEVVYSIDNKYIQWYQKGLPKARPYLYKWYIKKKIGEKENKRCRKILILSKTLREKDKN